MKRFFPKTAKPSAYKLPIKIRTLRKKIVGTPNILCISLKNEFDQIINDKYTKLSSEDRKNLWKTIGSQLISNNTTSTKEYLIKVLDQAHKNLPNNS